MDKAALHPFAEAAGKKGMSTLEIAGAFREQGVKAGVKNLFNVNELGAITARGTPVVTAVRATGGPTGFHAIVVDGVTTKPGLGKVIAIRDPGNNGSQFFLKEAAFLKKWTGEVVVPIKDWLP